MKRARSRPAPARQAWDAELRLGHQGGGLEFPFDPEAVFGTPAVALWPGRRGWRVRVRIAGQPLDTAIAGRMRRHWVLVDDDALERLGLQGGETVRVELLGPA